MRLCFSTSLPAFIVFASSRQCDSVREMVRQGVGAVISPDGPWERMCWSRDAVTKWPPGHHVAVGHVEDHPVGPEVIQGPGLDLGHTGPVGGIILRNAFPNHQHPPLLVMRYTQAIIMEVEFTTFLVEKTWSSGGHAMLSTSMIISGTHLNMGKVSRQFGLVPVIQQATENRVPCPATVWFSKAFPAPKQQTLAPRQPGSRGWEPVRCGVVRFAASNLSKPGTREPL